MNTVDFAKQIRDKYPDGISSDGKTYAEMSDSDLVGKIVAKYPVYKNQISDFKPSESGMIGSPLDAVNEFASDISKGFSSATDKSAEAIANPEMDLTRKALRVGGQIGNFVGDVELSALKLVAPKFVEDLAKKGIEKISGTELAKTLVSKLDEFKTANPEIAQDIEDVINIASIIPEIQGAKAAVSGGKMAFKAGGEAVEQVGKVTGDIVDAGKAARVAAASEEIDDVVKKILQGKPEDFVKGKKALMSLDLPGNKIKEYSELTNLADDGISALAKKVDETLEKQTPIVGKITKESSKIMTDVNGTTITQNFVDDALDQLQKLYKDTNDAVSQAKILDLRKKFDADGLSLKEFNDIAREYGSAKSGFNLKSGAPLAGVNTQMYENTRKGIKNTLRTMIPDESTRNAIIAMDDSMSNLYTLKRLSTKMEEQVYRLYNKVEKRGLFEKVAGKVANFMDVATLHTPRGFIQKFFPSNFGFKEGNALSIQERLADNLKKLNKLSKIKDESSYINDLVDLMKLNQINPEKVSTK